MPADRTLKLVIEDLVQFRELLGRLADWTALMRSVERDGGQLWPEERLLLAAVERFAGRGKARP